MSKEFAVSIKGMAAQIKQMRDEVKKLQKSGKVQEASIIQSKLVSERLALRAAYLAYGLLNGQCLSSIERKRLKTRPDSEYQVKFLCSQFSSYLEAYGYEATQKVSQEKMLRTHLGR